MLLGTVSCDHAVPFQRYASASVTQPEEVGMVPSPTVITSLAESALTPVNAQSASNTLHGPEGSARCDHLLAFQWLVCGVPESRPQVHALVAHLAVMDLSGA